ncbi:hypothetical protein HOY82DRAFT_535485 [Tuber indicum]|nr:hypothetical protein HOY82DRAFT_535485 [Tuber indicum]
MPRVKKRKALSQMAGRQGGRPKKEEITEESQEANDIDAVIFEDELEVPESQQQNLDTQNIILAAKSPSRQTIWRQKKREERVMLDIENQDDVNSQDCFAQFDTEEVPLQHYIEQALVDWPRVTAIHRDKVKDQIFTQE